jgi:shikimate 5-dehydrogenase
VRSTHETFAFVGVTTNSSAAKSLFPLWIRELGLGDTTLAGFDLPIHAERDRYRDVVSQIKGDPGTRGALITTHKIDLFEACRDLFDQVDQSSAMYGEASCLSKRTGRLRALATDPISAGRAVGEFLPRRACEVLCFGAGGAAIAITAHLMTREPVSARPNRITVTDLSETRIGSLRTIHEKLGTRVPVEYSVNAEPAVNDALLRQMPAGSLVINATGMGKDTPGSPLTDEAVFPEHAFAWDLNYRGELDFLRQAARQREGHSLEVHSGWRYFLHGWFVIIEEVFGVTIYPDRFEALAAVSEPLRPALVGVK